MSEALKEDYWGIGGYGDPLEHLRTVSDKVGFKVNPHCNSTGSLFHNYKSAREVSPRPYGNNLLYMSPHDTDLFYIALSYKDARLTKERKAHRKRFLSRLRYQFVRNPNLGSSSFATLTLHDLGGLIPFVCLRLSHCARGKNGFYMEIHGDTEENFRMDRVHLRLGDWQKRKNHSREDVFGDVLNCDYFDFRPYIHRGLELVMNIPQSDWHNPQIYSKYPIQQEVSRNILDTRITTCLEVLFDGSEREELKSSLEKASLNVGNSWCSIPRLNLGTITLPKVGENSSGQDEFVVSAAPLLVERLHTLGIMRYEEAEALISHKLANYFLHHQGFQLSPSRARQILHELNSGERGSAEGSA